MKNFILTILLISGVIVLQSCSEDGDSITIEPIEIDFSNSKVTGFESDSEIELSLVFSEVAPIDGSVTLIINELTASYGVEFTTEPVASNGQITIPVTVGISSFPIKIIPSIDDDSFSDSFEMIIASTSDKNLKVGTNRSSRVIINENGNGGNGGLVSCNDTDQTTGAVQCTPNLRSDQLDIVTWNIENFPMRSNTISKVIDIIEDLDADVYAIQEIEETSSFNTLVSSLNGYSGVAVNVNGRIELGYIFKDSEIASIGNTTKLFTGQTSPFPREPVMVDITHANGLTVKLINIHLKCCGGSEDRRTDASNRMKAYIDVNFPNDEVIILGDWNEHINSGSSFTNFINDSENYIFADQPIADGSTTNFSYPSWPSHLDHILITNELCDNLISTYTVRLGDCVSNYSFDVSDHRPVMISLSADN